MQLTNREFETLSLLALPRKVIAERMQIKERTVETLISKLFNKFAPMDSREKILVQAIKNGDIRIEDIVLE